MKRDEKFQDIEDSTEPVNFREHSYDTSREPKPSRYVSTLDGFIIDRENNDRIVVAVDSFASGPRLYRVR